jgi:hypothetical protein
MLTGTSNDTYFIVDGVRVFPCPCGETHAGDYAYEEMLHHMCLHRGGLLLLQDDYAVCGDCGQTFHVEEHRL